MRFRGTSMWWAVYHVRQTVGRAKRLSLYRSSLTLLRWGLTLHRLGFSADARLLISVSQRLRRLAVGR